MEEKLYTVKEVAEYFKVKVSAVHNWIARGNMNAVTTPGGERRVTDTEIKRIINQNKRG